MSARQKLNVAFMNGALIFGAVAGILSQSWIIALIVTVIALFGASASGQIRLSSRRPSRRSHRKH